MRTNKLIRLATRLRVSMAALVALGMAGTFTESVTRAMFLLPEAPAAAFVSVGEPEVVAYSAGYLVDRNGTRPEARRRGAQRLIPGTAPAGIITEDAPVPVAALTTNSNPLADAVPGVGGTDTGLVRPEANPLTALRTIPSETRPGTFAGIPTQADTTAPETPPPAVPEPPAWMLALAGMGLLAAFKYGKQYLGLKQVPALA
ncbi:MAG: hypothetical protein IT551_05780 [Novosphingobium sp.]|jgi:hypothetical protein|nr:hypothetical protein [Novosphingobium sp.]